MPIRSLLARVLERPRVRAIQGVLDAYGHAAGGLLANGLAFSALFAAIPTSLLVLGLVGWVASGDTAIQEEVSDALVAAFPPLAELIRGSVNAITEGAALTSVIGVVGLIWTVSQLVGAVDTAFARIFCDDPQRDLVQRTVLGLVSVALLGAAIVVAGAVLGALAAVDTMTGSDDSLARAALGAIVSAPFAAAASFVAVVIAYRTLPPRTPSWRVLLLPAAVVGSALLLLTQAFSFLVPRLVGAAELAGPLASGFVALVWLSLSFQAVLLGAAWVRIRVGARGAAGSSDEPPPEASTSLEGPAAAAESGGRGE